MRKFVITVSIIVIASVVWGIIAASSHTSLDFSHPETIDGLQVTYRLTEDVFLNAQELADKYETTEEEFAETETLQDRLFEEYETAKYISIVKATGEVQNKAGTLIQDAIVVKSIRGEFAVSEKLHFVMAGEGFQASLNIFFGSYCNIMKKDKEYLIFYSELDNNRTMPHGYYRVCSLSCIPYLCLEDIDNVIADPNPKDDMTIPYAEVVENEFFIEDEAANERALEMKQNIFHRYI